MEQGRLRVCVCVDVIGAAICLNNDSVASGIRVIRGTWRHKGDVGPLSRSRSLSL